MERLNFRSNVDTEYKRFKFTGMPQAIESVEQSVGALRSAMESKHKGIGELSESAEPGSAQN